MGKMELRYPNGERIIFDDECWQWLGENIVWDMHTDDDSVDNMEYLYEQDAISDTGE